MTIFNELQKDLLKEYINIAFGYATASIAELMNAFANLHIPKIDIVQSSQLEEYIDSLYDRSSGISLSQQVFNGTLSGESVFLMSSTSLENLTNFFYPDIRHTIEHKNDSLSELNNLLSVSTIGKLSEITNLVSEFLPPTIKHLDSETFIEKEHLLKYEQVIVISTILEFEKYQIKGFLFILSTEMMLQRLKESLDCELKKQIPEYDSI